MRRALLALPLLVVVAGCGSKHSTVTVTTKSPPAPVLQKAATACKAAQLRPDWLGQRRAAVFHAAGGTTVGSFGLRNSADEPCSLGSGLTVHLEPALVLQTTPPSPRSTGGPAAEAWLGSLFNQRVAGVSLQWANWCVKGKRPARVRIDLPDGGGSLAFPAPRALPRCYEISAPTTVSATVAPALGRLANNGGTVTSLDAEIVSTDGKSDPALATSAGGGLNYAVRLTNTSGKPLPAVSPPCPVFAQPLAGSTPVVERLDCAILGGLKAGASVVYQMWLTVPPLTQPGRHVLEWMLDPYSAQLPADTAPLQITPR